MVEKGGTKVKKKRKLIILTIIISIILLLSGMFSYWFLTRKFEIIFHFHWEYCTENLDHYINESGTRIFNETEMDVFLKIDNNEKHLIIENITKWYEIALLGISFYSKLKTTLSYGEHKIEIFYYNRTLSISKNIFISDNICIIIGQKSPTELYIDIQKYEPKYM